MSHYRELIGMLPPIIDRKSDIRDQVDQRDQNRTQRGDLAEERHRINVPAEDIGHGQAKAGEDEKARPGSARLRMESGQTPGEQTLARGIEDQARLRVRS